MSSVFQAKLGCMSESNGNKNFIVHVLDTSKERKNFDWGVQVHFSQCLRSAIQQAQLLQVEFGHLEKIDTSFLLKFGLSQEEIDEAWEDVLMVSLTLKRLFS